MSAKKDRGACQYCGQPLRKGQTVACSRSCAGHFTALGTLVYTSNQDALITKLWDEGHVTAEIARRLGVTKNAVIGRVRRLGLKPRPSPIIRDGTRQAPRPRIHRPHRAVSTLPPLNSAPRAPLPPQQLASLGRRPPLPPQMQESLSVGQLRLKLVNARPCQFPIWPHNERPPRDLSKRFCSKPVARIGSPYCEVCRRIAYTKKRKDEQELDMPAFVVVAGRRVLTDEGKRRIVAGQKRVAA